jgi:hypothetical protein
MWGWNWLEGIGQDIRYGLRMLRKNPGFTAVAVFVLAVGISGAMAMFGFADAALIKPLPYRDPSRLVVVFASSPGYARSWGIVPGLCRLEAPQQGFQFHRCIRTERQLHS